MASADVETVLRCYPQIYFACHRRHVRDERGKTISIHQAGVLDHLDDVEGTSLLGLARHMGVTASTMSLTIDRLEAAGYVTRGRNGEDRRRIDVRLTPAGVGIKRQQKVLEPELVAGLLDRLADRDRRAALRGLDVLARAAVDWIASGEWNRALKGGTL